MKLIFELHSTMLSIASTGDDAESFLRWKFGESGAPPSY